MYVNKFALPFLVFWILLWLGREQLGVRGVFFLVVLWALLFWGFSRLGWTPYLFVSAQAIIDVVLILVVFGHDIRIR